MHLGVIICTYNEEANIERCIESVLLQSEIYVSLFVSDNQSTDKTVNLIEGYGKKVKCLRIESQSLVSVYQHYANAQAYFRKRFPDINWWMNIGADDYLEGDQCLQNLALRAKELNPRLSASESVGIVPKVKVIDSRNGSFFFAKRLPSFIPLRIRSALYYLMPRSWQPLTFYFSLFNSNALDLCIDGSNFIESFRRKHNSKMQRSPESETLWSLFFASNVKLFNHSSSIYVRKSFNRVRSEINLKPSKNWKRLSSITSKIEILQKSFYMVTYIKLWKEYLPRRSYSWYLFLLPLQIALDISSVLTSALRRRAFFKLNVKK